MKENVKQKMSIQMKCIIAIAIIFVLFLIGMIGLFFARINPAEARQIALNTIGGNAEIVSEEQDTEFLFFSEYSYELYNDSGYYEIEISPFGHVTSMEHQQGIQGISNM